MKINMIETETDNEDYKGNKVKEMLYKLAWLYIAVFIFWKISRKQHEVIQVNSIYTVRLPDFLSIVFGGKGAFSVFSIGGIIGQLLTVSVAVIYTLKILGYVSDENLATVFMITSLLISIISAWIYIKFRNIN